MSSPFSKYLLRNDCTQCKSWDMTEYSHAVSPGINTSKRQDYTQEKCSQTMHNLLCSIFTHLYNKIKKDFRVPSPVRLSQKPEEQREMQSENSLFSRFRTETLPSFKVRDHRAKCYLSIFFWNTSQKHCQCLAKSMLLFQRQSNVEKSLLWRSRKHSLWCYALKHIFKL